MDLCACRYEADDSTENLPKFFMIITPVVVEVGGNNFQTL